MLLIVGVILKFDAVTMMFRGKSTLPIDFDVTICRTYNKVD